MKTTAEMIGVMKAYAEGEAVEILETDGRWSDIAVTPSWNWKAFDYRIKPKPMEFWVNVYEGRNSFAFCNKPAAVSAACSNVLKTIKVREVTDE